MTPKNNTKFRLTRKITASAVALMLPVSGALAQSLYSADEITVTARKKDENLMEVPLAITAFSETELERQNVFAMEDLAQWTPSLQFQDVNGAFQNATIRGLAQTDQISPQGNVGVFLDGVYLSNRSGLEFGLLDLARVEVVKGPQSALYGRNTFAGAINYVTKAPSTEDFEGRIEGTIGTKDRYSLSGSLNIPIGDFIAIRAFAGFSEFDGTIENVRDGQLLGGYDDRDAYGGSILIEPSDNFRLTLFGARNVVKNDPPALSLLPATDNNCGSPTVNSNGDPRFTLFCGDLPQIDTVNVLNAEGLNGDAVIFYGKLEYEFEHATLTALASHSDAGYTLAIDTSTNPDAINIPTFGGLSAQTLIDASTPTGNTETYELRLAQNDGGLDWSVGAYIYDSLDEDILQVFFLPLGNPDGEPSLVFARNRLVQTNSWSIFGSLSYEFSDNVTASAEVRYTDETLKLVNGEPGEELDFSYVSPRFTLEWSATEDSLFYASVAQGVKTGGFNANVPADTTERTFDTESNWTYEVGNKSTWLDGRLVTNVNAFWVNWKDVQIQTQVETSDLSAVQNFGSITSYGAEFDATGYVTDNFSIRTAVAWLNPEYDEGFIDGEVVAACGGTFPGSFTTEPRCSTEVGGNQVSRTSDFQAVVSGNYVVPGIVSDYDGYFRADFSHEASKFNTGLNFSNQGEINLFNLRAGIANDKFELAVWVDNVLDTKWNRRVTSAPNLAEGGSITGITEFRVYPGDLRTIGVDLKTNF